MKNLHFPVLFFVLISSAIGQSDIEDPNSVKSEFLLESKLNHKQSYNQKKSSISIMLQKEEYWDADSVGRMNNDFLRRYEYNWLGQLTKSVYEKRSGGQFFDATYDEFKYDSNGNLIQESEFTWDGVNWIGRYQENYVYNGNGKEIENVTKSWKNGGWVNMNRVLTTINAKGKVTMELLQSWDQTNKIWKDVLKDILVYDANDFLIKEETYTYYSSSWGIYSRITFTNNSMGFPIEVLKEQFNGVMWENNQKFTRTYNSSNQMVIDESQLWTSGSWENLYYARFSYDAIGNNKGLLFKVWNGNAWVDYYKENMRYDESVHRSAIAWPSWHDEEASRKILNYTDFVVADSSWTPLDSTHFVYSAFVDLEELLANDISLYPIPAASELTIQSESDESFDLALFDLKGSAILEVFNNTGITTVNVSELSAGEYIIQISTDRGVFRKKLVIK